jgi:hypothetical protein
MKRVAGVLVVLAVLVVLGAVDAQAQYRSKGWANGPADLYGTSNLNVAVDDLDSRMDALGMAEDTDTPTVSTMVITNLDTTTVEYSGGPTVEASLSNRVEVTFSSSGVDQGRFQLIGGKTLSATGDDMFIDIVATDTNGASVTNMVIAIDQTDATPASEDATMTIQIPIAGTLTTVLTLNSAGTVIRGTKFNTGIQDGTNALAAGDLYYVAGDSNRVYRYTP